MKKVFSFVAALVAVMVMAVSCGTVSQNTKDALAIMENIQAGNYNAVDSLCNKLYSVKGDLTADESIGVLSGMNFLILKYSEQGDAASLTPAVNNFIDMYDVAAAKQDAAKVFEEAKNQGVDFPTIAESYKAQLAEAAKLAEEAAAAAAEDEDAEDEDAEDAE